MRENKASPASSDEPHRTRRSARPPTAAGRSGNHARPGLACESRAGVVRSALILIGLAALLAVADWMWVLPSPAHGMILLGALALAILGLLRAWPRVDPRQIALAVEQ